jgi:hypothetical protein
MFFFNLRLTLKGENERKKKVKSLGDSTGRGIRLSGKNRGYRDYDIREWGVTFDPV